MQSAILWEVMKSYKILENAVISTQRDNHTSQNNSIRFITTQDNSFWVVFMLTVQNLISV